MTYVAAVELRNTRFDPRDGSVNRLSYGVYFRYLGEFNPPAGMWHHTLKIALPRVDTTQTNRVSDILGERPTSSNGRCIYDVIAGELLPKPPTRIVPHKTDICKDMEPLLHRIAHIINTGYDEMRRLITTIRSLVPDGSVLQRNRQSRAILGFIGDLSHTIFGTARDVDVARVEKHVKAIAENQKHELEVFKKSISDMASFMAKEESTLSDLLNKVRAQQIQNLQFIEQSRNATWTFVNVQASLLLKAMEFEQNLAAINRHYSNYLNAVELMQTGVLPHYLISKADMSALIGRINNILQGSGYRLAHEREDYYYSNAEFIYTQFQSSLFITLYFPLTNFQNPFKAFEISKWPLREFEGENFVQLSHPWWGVAVDSSRRYFMQLNEEEGLAIQNFPHRLVRLEHVTMIDNDTDCIMSIFGNDKPTIMAQKCAKFLNVHRPRGETKGHEPGIFHVQANNFIFVNIEGAQMSCPRGVSTEYSCKFCVIEVPDNCSATSREGYYLAPLIHTGRVDLTKPSRILNLPLLGNFFNQSSLRLIRGDSLLPELPEVKVPKFKFYADRTNKTFLRPEEEKVELHKAVQAVKEDAQIASSLTEAVVLDEVSNKLGFWQDSPGIVLESLVGVIGLLIMVVIWLLMKTQKLSAVVAAMQVRLLTIKSAEALDTLAFNYVKNQDKEVVPFNRTAITEIVVSTSIQMGPYLVVTLVVVIVLLCIFKRWNKIAIAGKIHGMNSEFWLEINDGIKSILVLLCKVHGLPDDFKAHASTYLDTVRVVGTLRPKILIDWETFRFVNSHTGVGERMKSEVDISLWQGFRIRRLIQRPYVCLLLTRYNGKFARVPVLKDLDAETSWQTTTTSKMGVRLDPSAPMLI